MTELRHGSVELLLIQIGYREIRWCLGVSIFLSVMRAGALKAALKLEERLRPFRSDPTDD